MQEVSGSTPLFSTNISLINKKGLAYLLTLLYFYNNLFATTKERHNIVPTKLGTE